MARLPEDEPAHAHAENGEVLIDGPNGLAVSLTPRAALLSAAAITQAAHEAERQEAAKQGA